MLNDYIMEYVVMEPMRGKATLDLITSGKKYLVHGVNVRGPVGNSDHKTIRFNIFVGVKFAERFFNLI